VSGTDAPEPTVDQADVQATFCATLVDEWVLAGVTDAVVSPGSRSTPMALALAAHEALAVHVHHDERAAGFVALGLGLATDRPAIVLTTSGTAAVELHPAVVEAHQAGVPLLVLTADRPPELHHVGAPQTVEQSDLYGVAVRWAFEPGVADRESAGTWRSLASRTVAEATTGPLGPGPAHLNLAFREPLVGTAGSLPPRRPDGRTWHTTEGRRASVDRAGTERLAELLDADRGVIVAGAGAGQPDAVLALARATGWPVLAEPRSGCRLPDPTVVAAFDSILRHAATADRLRPDVILQLAAPPASKVLGQWAAASEATLLAVDRHGRWFDPAHQAAHVLHADPTAAVAALVQLVGGRQADDGWTGAWQRAEAAAQESIERTLLAHPEPTEPSVARSVVAAFPDDATLVVSSSMPVRDVEWFAAPRTGLRVLANRGANGIDGVVSTAVGVALSARGTSVPTAVLVGDVAFLHDANALLGVAGREIDLTIVVVDNDGGGIFSFLPQAGSLPGDRFETLFGTPHGVDIPTLAAAHGLVTVTPSGSAAVHPAIAASVAAGGVRLVHVQTDRAANVALHDEINAAVSAALEDLAG